MSDPKKSGEAAPPRLLVDHMLIKLGKYLRIIGFDAAWDAACRTHELIKCANDEGRVFLTRNRRIDAVRKEKRPELDPADPMLVPDAPEAADERLDALEREVRITRALKTLPKEQADLVHEAFYLAKSHSQIADETKIPLGTVKSRLRLAFGRLRKAIEGEEMP